MTDEVVDDEVADDGVDLAQEGGVPARFAPWQWVVLGVAVLFLAGAVGYFVGTSDDRAAPGAGSVDVGFLQDMISHHEQAIEMANLEIVGGAEPSVRIYAREILLFQSYEVGLMDRQLNVWGHHRQQRSDDAMTWMDMTVPVAQMPGLASEQEMDALGELSGRDVDALFLQLMQDHHAGGVHMAEYAADHASNAFVRDLAARMARNQAIEIRELDKTRLELGLSEEPRGYEGG